VTPGERDNMRGAGAAHAGAGPWNGQDYRRMQRPTMPAVLHFAPAPCCVAAPSLQIAETSTSPSLQLMASPDAST
jgi:hypothetical protein